MKKLAKTLYKKSQKEQIIIVPSKKLEQNQELKEQIKEYGLKLLDGNWLEKFLLCDMISYITKKENKKQETQIVALLMQKQDDIIISQLPEIAKKIKTLKIIADPNPTYDYIERKLYSEYGIAMQITNNKTKSLTNADIIINMDYTKEKIEEYNINPKAKIINIQEKNEEKTKTNINNYKIEYNKEKYTKVKNAENYNQNILYESYIYRKDTYQNIRKQMLEDDVKIIEAI